MREKDLSVNQGLDDTFHQTLEIQAYIKRL
jgi:hypothetical protein